MFMLRGIAMMMNEDASGPLRQRGKCERLTAVSARASSGIDAMSKTDADTTVAELRELVDDFVCARNWSQFHSPKNLSMALSIEAAELMEHFQWLEAAESRQLREHPEKLTAAMEEVADVLAYTLAIANSLDIDLSAALQAKMIKNESKYPVDEYHGRHGGK